MLETLISSKTRIKLLLKFFLNSKNKGYLRGLEQEFGESSNSIRIELNRLEGAGMLNSTIEGNKKVFSANTSHPLFNEVHNILRKNLGIDKIIEKIVYKLGTVESVYLVGALSKGQDSPIVDLVFCGKIDTQYLITLISKVEELIGRKIRYIIYESSAQLEEINKEAFLLWSNEKSES